MIIFFNYFYSDQNMDLKYTQIDILNKKQFNDFLKNEELLFQLYTLYSEKDRSGYSLVRKSFEEFRSSYQEYKNTHTHLFLVFDGKDLVGAITSHREDRNTAYISRFAVRTKYQGNDIGRILMIKAYGSLLKKFKYKQIEMTARAGAQIINKLLCGVTKIGLKKRQFNGQYRYSLNPKTTVKENKSEYVTIKLKKQTPKIKPKVI